MQRLLILTALLSLGVSCSALPPSSQEVIGHTLTREISVTATDDYIISESTFLADAGDILVAYTESDVISEVKLYAPNGEEVDDHHYYPNDIILAEYDGEHGAVTLPVTGEYRLLEKTRPDRAGSDDEVSFRIASDYEDAMIRATSLTEDGEHEAAYVLLGETIEQYPNLPQPYIWRVTAQFSIIENADNLDIFESPVQPIHEELYAKYNASSAARQRTIISDLRLSAEKLEDIEGDFKSYAPYNIEFSLALAEYFETGELPALFR